MRRLATVILGTLAIAACSAADQATAPDASMAGTYQLKTMAGSTLPYIVLQQPGLDLKVTAESMTLDAAGAFTDITSYLRINNGVVDYPVDTLVGTWSAYQSNVTLVAKGQKFGGTVVGNTLTLSDGVLVSVYTR
ncbi:MAG: hypothetical protein ABJA80_14040 [bacterium]